MPIIDVSGLTSSEDMKKRCIRKEIKKYFAKKLNIPESGTTVTFISDETTGEEESVVARMYSKYFLGLDEKELEGICDDIVEILEEAGHPFSEVLLVSILMIYASVKAKNFPH